MNSKAVMDGRGIRPPDALLKADSTIIVPPLCMARIPHGIDLEIRDCRVFLVPEAHTFSALSLLVPVRVVEEGEVITYVFNLSNLASRVNRGDIISRLVAL